VPSLPCLVSGVSVVAAVLAVAAATGPGGRDLQSPSFRDLAYAYRPVAEPLARPSVRVQTDRAAESFHTAAGEPVDIRVSPRDAFDTTQIQEWVDFLGSLLHGPELQTVILYLAPPTEVAFMCGRGAAACYFPPQRTIVTPGEDLAADLTAESLLAHEFGHHLANSSSNPPWEAVEYGTKRWATHAGICPAVRRGEVVPSGAGEHYALNPGEGFAEAYRVANQRRLGVAESPWEIVSTRFYPDATALTLIEQDALSPWTTPTTVSYPSSFRRGRSNLRTFEVPTPLDGTARASIRAPKGTSFRLSKAPTTVCGERTTTFSVRRVNGFGSFRLFVSRP
jgi:hypothetical protein